jgi:hypothetical protein
MGKRFTLWIPETDQQQFEVAAARRGVPLAEWMRTILREAVTNGGGRKGHGSSPFATAPALQDAWRRGYWAAWWEACYRTGDWAAFPATRFRAWLADHPLVGWDVYAWLAQQTWGSTALAWWRAQGFPTPEV